jgi:LysM repeat protein
VAAVTVTTETTVIGVPSAATHPAAITIATTDKRLKVVALPGPNDPTITEGRGGWSEVARPRRIAISEWTGPALHKAHVELLLDAWAVGGTVDAQIAIIDQMAPRSPQSEPPIITVVGYPSIPNNLQWSIQSVSPADQLRRPDGRTTRITLVLELLEYRVSDLVVVRPSPAKASVARNSTPTPSTATTVTVKAGDTLSSIAARYLGSAAKWSSIASLNGIRDPNRLTIGQVLKLPTGTTANAGHAPTPTTQATVAAGQVLHHN